MTDLMATAEGEDRVQLADRVQDSHEAWCEFWELGSLKKKPPYVPLFFEWIESGDWENPPSEWQIEAIRKAPNRELTIEEKLDHAFASGGDQ